MTPGLLRQLASFWNELSAGDHGVGRRQRSGRLRRPRLPRGPGGAGRQGGGNNSWGVESFLQDDVEYAALSDRDSGLYILRYTPAP